MVVKSSDVDRIVTTIDTDDSTVITVDADDETVSTNSMETTNDTGPNDIDTNDGDGLNTNSTNDAAGPGWKRETVRLCWEQNQRRYRLRMKH